MENKAERFSSVTDLDRLIAAKLTPGEGDVHVVRPSPNYGWTPGPEPEGKNFEGSGRIWNPILKKNQLPFDAFMSIVGRIITSAPARLMAITIRVLDAAVVHGPKVVLALDSFDWGTKFPVEYFMHMFPLALSGRLLEEVDKDGLLLPGERNMTQQISQGLQ